MFKCVLVDDFLLRQYKTFTRTTHNLFVNILKLVFTQNYTPPFHNKTYLHMWGAQGIEYKKKHMLNAIIKFMDYIIVKLFVELFCKLSVI